MLNAPPTCTGSSMMFGFGDEGQTNLLTRCLAAVGKKMETVPDPVQIHYHLPKGGKPNSLDVKVRHPHWEPISPRCTVSSAPILTSISLPQVWREYDKFLGELVAAFPHEAEGIRKFYDECWVIFDALNSLELKSLEEPRYLLGQFAREPVKCLNLASYLPVNTGDVARKYIKARRAHLACSESFARVCCALLAPSFFKRE